MDSVTVLNVVSGKGFMVFENSSRINQALTISGCICIIGTRKHILEFGDWRGYGESECKFRIVRCLDIEGDGRLLRYSGIIGHDIRVGIDSME